MSAWEVSKAHIDALVQEMGRHGLIRNADKAGQMLLAENHKSLRARYGDRAETYWPGMDKRASEYHFNGIESPLDPVKMDTLARCYDYQTCEHSGYEASEAFSLIHELGVRLGIPEDAGLKGPWGIETIEEAV